MAQDLIVLKVDKARLLLAQARNATDAKKVADLARAAEVYAQRQKLSEEVIQYAREVKIDALTLAGEMLEQAPKNKGGGTGSNQHRAARTKRVQAAPTREEVFGKGGRKVAAEAKALADLKKNAPVLYRKVKMGELTVAKAKREVQKDRKRKKLEERAKAAPPGKVCWEVINGDCVSEIGKHKPRLIFADPPYNQGIDYGDGSRADRLTDWDYLAWCMRWIAACHLSLADDGSMWILTRHEYAAAIEFLARGDVVLQYRDDKEDSILRAFDTLPAAAFNALAGIPKLHIRSWVTWYETFGVNCANGFNRCSRRLLHLVKDANRFIFNTDAVTRLSARQTEYNDSRADPGGKIWDDVWIIPRLVGTARERIPDFPTQLPLALVRPIVLCCSEPGDLVLDPFSGSGTTGVAAIESERRFIGIEKSAKFAELSRLRLKGVSNG